MRKITSYDLKISLGGELERILVPLILKYSKITFFIVSLFMPMVIIFTNLNNNFKWIGIFWILWLVALYIYNTFNDIKNMNIIIFIFTLPMSFPVYITTITLYNRLKNKYPNSDDPEKIKKFNRVAKIKQIL